MEITDKELFSISPIDGRYQKETQTISNYFSEYAYIHYRIQIEIEWLKYLLEKKILPNISVTTFEISLLNSIYTDFTIEEAKRVKQIEEITKHDVKAIEYYVRQKIIALGLEKFSAFIHFGCTSEDINNLAYSLMIKDFLTLEFFPTAKAFLSTVETKATETKALPMLAHTHGQPASPTTMGKELAVFVYRWKNILHLLEHCSLTGKFSGAVGCFNALAISYPKIDWLSICKNFVEKLGIIFNPLTTQIESHDNLCVLLNLIKSFNNITYDFNSDMWLYISFGYFTQNSIKTEIGSSVMPHKINPINHENSMANCRIANALINSLVENLPCSRMQRDLSDSSMLRNLGVLFSHSLLTIKQSKIGFEKMKPNEEMLKQELDNNPEVLAEAIQMILRKNGNDTGYESLKELTRGKKITIQELQDFISKLSLPKEEIKRLLNLSPSTYTGIASKLVEFCKD